MSECAHVRQLLAAYRRDDWMPEDLDALTLHLTTCAECRQIEASYRGVGEHIRQLPSIVPSPELRTRVFAAIHAERLRVAPEVARASRMATDPSIPVVRPAARVIRPSVTRFRPGFALATAAALLIALISARVVAQGGVGALGGNAASLPTTSPLALNQRTGGGVARYSVDGSYALATGALATEGWIVYSATNAAHGGMLFAENRGTKQRTALLTAPRQTTLTLRALTERWAVWTTGASASRGAWALYASPLPATQGQTHTTPITLVDSSAATGDTPATFGGVWADGDTVLVAASTAHGSGVLMRYDLSQETPIPTVIARASAPGHMLTNPSSVNGAYYWAEVWFDGATGLHSVIWRGDASGHTQKVSADENAFHPQVSQNTLVWVEVSQATLSASAKGGQSAQPNADEALLNQLAGSLQAQSLTSGQRWQISPQANVPSVEANGPIVVWQSAAQLHTYDLRDKAPSSVDTQVRSASFADETASALTWNQGANSPLYVFDAQ